MPAQRKKTPEARIAEYVDSPLMTQRLRHGKQISARIAGNYGVYRTRTSRLKKADGDCTCPSELWPCKHIHALRATWEANPKSFFDLDAWLKQLPKQPKETLVEMIAAAVTESPQLLGAFSVPGFEEEEVDDEDDEWSDEFED